jgi:hypothetical protein
MNSSATVSSSTSGFTDGEGLGVGDGFGVDEDFGVGGAEGDGEGFGVEEGFGEDSGVIFSGGDDAGFLEGDGEGVDDGEGERRATALESGRQSARVKTSERSFISGPARIGVSKPPGTLEKRPSSIYCPHLSRRIARCQKFPHGRSSSRLGQPNLI